MPHQCAICIKLFTKKGILNRHQREVHTENRRIFICNECDLTCPNKTQFLKHWKNEHNEIRKRNFTKICPLCGRQERNIEAHFNYEHNIEIQEKTLEFDNVNCFHAWKKEIENKTSKFVLTTTNKLKNAKLRKLYVCNRSGSYESKSNGLRRLKVQGYRKINGFCPASMTVTISSQVHVKFVDCHLGHKHDIFHFNISPTKKEQIAALLMKKVPKKGIIDEISNYRGENITRDDVITTKDINNIRLRYNISTEFKKNGATQIPIVNEESIEVVGPINENVFDITIDKTICEKESILNNIVNEKQDDFDMKQIDEAFKNLKNLVNKKLSFISIVLQNFNMLEAKLKILTENDEDIFVSKKSKPIPANENEKLFSKVEVENVFFNRF